MTSYYQNHMSQHQPCVLLHRNYAQHEKVDAVEYTYEDAMSVSDMDVEITGFLKSCSWQEPVKAIDTLTPSIKEIGIIPDPVKIDEGEVMSTMDDNDFDILEEFLENEENDFHIMNYDTMTVDPRDSNAPPSSPVSVIHVVHNEAQQQSPMMPMEVLPMEASFTQRIVSGENPTPIRLQPRPQSPAVVPVKENDAGQIPIRPVSPRGPEMNETCFTTTTEYQVQSVSLVGSSAACQMKTASFTSCPSAVDAEQLWHRLQASMARSAKSLEALQARDKKLGLPKSHSPTMVNSSRSRKQLQNGIILPKWNGKPLIAGDGKETKTDKKQGKK